MSEVPDTVDDALDALSAPSTDEVILGTRDFSARELAAAANSRGGGGAQTVLTATVVLETADILALNTTPVEVVPAPGTGKQVFPLSVISFVNIPTTPFDLHLQDIAVDYAGEAAVGNTMIRMTHNGSRLENVGSASVWWKWENLVPGYFLTQGNFNEDSPLVVYVPSENPTGGDGQMTITVAYYVVPLPDWIWSV